MGHVPHIRITAHFTLGNPTVREEASCTLNFDPGATTDPLPAGLAVLAHDAFDDWASWMADVDSKVHSSVVLDQVKCYHIDSTGHSDRDIGVSDQAPVRGATAAGNSHPWQCSNVVTLVAGTRGKGRFGRIYLPPQITPINADGVIDESFHSVMFARAASLLTDLSDKPGFDAGFKLCVSGQTGAGTLRPVDHLRMGHVMDTQRRRRRSLSEAYAEVAFSG